MKQVKVLLLDFDPVNCLGGDLRGILESSSSAVLQLRRELIEVCEPPAYDGGLSKTALRFNPDIVFTVMTGSLLQRGGSLIEGIRKGKSELPIIIVVEEGEPEQILELLKLGADDFIAPPLRAIDVLPRLWRLMEKVGRRETLIQTLKEKIGLKQIVGECPSFLSEISKIPPVAKCDANVLILGETGTGKELCARAIHYLSPRANKPFIPANCGAIPAELVENELFGHERGAFTDASTSQTGLVREADGGTLFLDEIDCLSLSMQVKFLRFLQEKEYRPLGSAKIRKADVRIVAATNVDLESAMEGGKFRRDLYYRLNVIPLILPPLRERREDIPLLAQHFLAKYADRFKKQATGFSPDAVQRLMFYDWPGNVRELEHAIERAVLLSEHTVIQAADTLPGLKSIPDKESFQTTKARFIEQFEKNYIQGLLLTHQGNITRAAEAAKKNRRAFWQLIRKYGIDAQSFRETE